MFFEESATDPTADGIEVRDFERNIDRLSGSQQEIFFDKLKDKLEVNHFGEFKRIIKCLPDSRKEIFFHEYKESPWMRHEEIQAYLPSSEKGNAGFKP